MKIAILGAGAWGTALSVALSARHAVALWARNEGQAASLRTSRRNIRYLPDVVLPDAVSIESDFGRALNGAELALISTPAAALRATVCLLRENCRESGRNVPPVICASKGFESVSARLPHQVVVDELGEAASIAILSGPSFALEVAQGRPTALTLASDDAAFAERAARDLHQPTLRVYFTTDVIGVAIGGAVKNVMAIATGICDGLELGHNARAALITRGLAEITRLGVALEGRRETFMGLAGAGDLILTSTGELSRNRRVGLMLARGHALEAILRELGHVAEGVQSAKEVERLARGLGVDMPITRSVCSVMFEGISPVEGVEQLLARDPRIEE
ncbi:MAG: NAD(P)-dependent glycerol-3-phosphate dehydrogenase [Betaproteobacteria bacterium]|nr:NAD(P)-dependent glycerol-3-phosphate dehydrogenase [Betaproteobacteria bacterium]